MTPMMKQYHAMKRQYEGAILLFHLGDFYETFYDDASICSEVLGITLTSRSKDDKGKIPLAGIPVRSAPGHMEKLLRAGYRVAICDQVEDPALAKGIVKREITRILTPGTVTEGGMIEEKDNNFLLAVCRVKSSVGLSWIDLSTGEFMLEDIDESQLADEVSRIDPAEILVPGSFDEDTKSLLSGYGCMITTQNDDCFDRSDSVRRLQTHFKVRSLDGFGCKDAGPSLCAAGAALGYLSDTQKNSLPHITSLSMYVRSDTLALDRTTRRNLDILRSASTGDRRFSCFGTLDRTVTAMGGRLLQTWLAAPLVDLLSISARHDSVDELRGHSSLRDGLRAGFREVKDIERLGAKVACRRANARDLVALRNSFRALPDIREMLSSASTSLLDEAYDEIDPLRDLEEEISMTIVDEPPMEITEGGLIRKGFDEELDGIRDISKTGKGWLAELEAREKASTGIPSLKIGFNKVFGYYIEVTHTHSEKIPPHYMRKQTMKNAERFVTEELKEYETRVLTSEERSKEIEHRIFTDLRDRTASQAERILRTARAIARVDALLSLAQAAADNNYCRPSMTSEKELYIREGRHPVVESTLKTGDFTPNDTNMNGQSDFIILTGPNMSGKSTYIRQVALTCIMAQAGSFVPAAEARIGVVDRVFTRVGASDEIARGQSTFMVEMNETALILNNATERSLVILDEVGRGTSTLDGLSIAWAVAEHIHNNIKCRTLFATHFHELTDLTSELGHAANYNVAVREWGDEVVFLHKIETGESDKSYGIHVARLAGVPDPVIERAKSILQELESQTISSSGRITGRNATQLSLFDWDSSETAEELKKLNIDNMTPLEAMLKLREIRESLNDNQV